MKISEVSQWIALLTKGTVDDGIARFGKKVSELAGRDLVTVAPTDPRFREVDLEYDPSDKSRLLLVDANFDKPQTVAYDQLVKRFGAGVRMQGPIDDFSGDSPGTSFIFVEGKQRFTLSLFHETKPDETVEVSRVSLRRLIPLEFPPPTKDEDEATTR